MIESDREDLAASRDVKGVKYPLKGKTFIFTSGEKLFVGDPDGARDHFR
jgi:hypothetical protein